MDVNRLGMKIDIKGHSEVCIQHFFRFSWKSITIPKLGEVKSYLKMHSIYYGFDCSFISKIEAFLRNEISIKTKH